MCVRIRQHGASSLICQDFSFLHFTYSLVKAKYSLTVHTKMNKDTHGKNRTYNQYLRL